MLITRKSYLLGLVVIFVAAYSQYIFRGHGLALGTIIVYGIPVLVTCALGGLGIIRKALNKMHDAVKYGLGFFGAFTVLGILVSTVILLILVLFDPKAANLLQRPNPVLNIPPQLAWTMVWFSLIVVGPAEEYLFRGFMYGGLLHLSKQRHWLSLAFASSLLFAAVHLYYATVYGIASLIQFTDIVTFGMAMAATYYMSGGNLLVPAIIHGAYDATGFIGVAVSLTVGLELRGVMILIGIVVALVVFAQRAQQKTVRPPVPPIPAPPPDL